MNTVLLSGVIYEKSIQYKEKTDKTDEYIKFNLAVVNSYKNKKTNKYEYSYIPCISWGGTANFIKKYFCEGRAMEVKQGELRKNKYIDKGGNEVYETVVNISEVGFAPTDFSTRVDQPVYKENENNEELTAEEIEEMNFYLEEVKNI